MIEFLKQLWHIENIKKIAAITAFICSIIVGFLALYIEPPGIIDQSVLWWVAQLLCFSAGILGISLNINGLASTKNKQDKEDESK